MRIGIVVAPFLPVPPVRYGGTELFVAHLAQGLSERGADVVVYTNGESTVPVERRWLYRETHWPLHGDVGEIVKEADHAAWAMADAARDCDVLHLNSAVSLTSTRFVTRPCVYTLHHTHAHAMSDSYGHYPLVRYVAISDFQRRRERMPHLRTIHHGIDMKLYRYVDRKQAYLSFVGRIAPSKGTHLAIEVARRTGIPLRIGGEIQPEFRDYYESKVRPHIDGRLVEYVGEVDLARKNELLGNSMAMLFPTQWAEPFGLTLIEAMACGTPVVALHGGSVDEIVRDGVSGWLCRSVDEMVAHTMQLAIPAASTRHYVERRFSRERMTEQYLELYAELLDWTNPSVRSSSRGGRGRWHEQRSLDR